MSNWRCDFHTCQLIVDHGGYELVFTCKSLYERIKIRSLPEEYEKKFAAPVLLGSYPSLPLDSYLLRNLEKITVHFDSGITLNHLSSLKTIEWIGRGNFSWDSISECTRLESIKVWIRNSQQRTPPRFPLLRKLHMKGTGDIPEGYLDGLCLEELSLPWLTIDRTFDVSHMSRLTVLRADGPSVITQDCLSKLNLRELSISHNNVITGRVEGGASFLMTNLKVLNISYSRLGQDQIDKLNLEILSVSGNGNVKSVNHMESKLKILGAGGSCGISDEGIKGAVSLTSLDVEHNSKVTDVNHLTRLVKLYAGGDCGITDGGMSKLVNLTRLDVEGNPGVTCVSHLTRLTELHIGGICGVTDEGIRGMVNLTYLNAGCNPNITDVNHLTRLKNLYAWGDCGITDEGIRGLVSLTHLDVDSNTKITDVNHLTRLVELHAWGDCGITDEGLRGLVNLTHLDVSYNPKVTDVNRLTRLVELYAGGTCGIADEGIRGLVNLMYLNVNNNAKITSQPHDV